MTEQTSKGTTRCRNSGPLSIYEALVLPKGPKRFRVSTGAGSGTAPVRLHPTLYAKNNLKAFLILVPMH